MARPEYFRQNAETCLASARRSDSTAERMTWLMRAERWLRLAQEADAKADDEPLTPGRPAPADQEELFDEQPASENSRGALDAADI